MNFEIKESTIKQFHSFAKIKYKDDFKIIIHQKDSFLIPNNPTKKIKRKNLSENNINKYVKYKSLFHENIEKENKLKLYIKNSNELLLSEEEFKQAYKKIKDIVTKNKIPVNSPIAITLGGQPGSGKSNIYKIAKKRFSDNIVELDCDAFRFFHPYHKQIKKMFGKDFTNKTTPFAFKIVTLLIDELSDKKYNLIMESSLNNPNIAIQNGKLLPLKGYQAELHVMATSKIVSWQSTIDRYNNAIKKGENARIVSREFHDKVVANICKNLDIVKKSGTMSNILLFDRNKNCLYNMKKDKDIDPSLLLFNILNEINEK